MDLTGIFLFGGICAAISFLVTIFTGINIWRGIALLIGLPLLVTFFIGIMRMQCASSITEINKIAAETLNSITMQGVEHFIFSVGGSLVGMIIGMFITNKKRNSK